MHPRNRHKKRYDFNVLVTTLPALAEFVIPHPVSGETIDFSDPQAVRVLNQALLKQFYGIQHWDLPPTYLCPPIPGRADYIHHVADLIKVRGRDVHVLDVGVGANCIYPLIGHKEYEWSFVGSDIDLKALMAADKIISENHLNDVIELRSQKSPSNVFLGIIQPNEKFQVTICNPPFHASLEEAEAESQRKWKHLGLEHKAQHRNFGGQGSELWCEGGEPAFLKSLVMESRQFKERVEWFTTLVSKEKLLRPMEASLEKIQAAEIRVINMEQGQKKSRIVAWRF